MRQFLLFCCLALAAVIARAEVIDIDNAELAQLMTSGVPVVDIRTQPEWEDTGVLAGSKLLTFYDERGRADPAAWLEKLKPIAKPGDPVVVICRSGNRTKTVSQLLSQQAGYAKIYNVKSGMKGWIGSGGAVVSASQGSVALR
jgi:rhodanese-related sulfurtransferase